jgi:hypothetical protein
MILYRLGETKTMNNLRYLTGLLSIPSQVLTSFSGKACNSALTINLSNPSTLRTIQQCFKEPKIGYVLCTHRSGPPSETVVHDWFLCWS